MIKDQIIELAKTNGFTSEFLNDKPYKYSSKEDLRWLFWLTELQKWFRKMHDIHVEVICWKKEPGDLKSKFESGCAYDWCECNDEEGLPENMFPTYEQALEDSILECFRALDIKPIEWGQIL